MTVPWHPTARVALRRGTIELAEPREENAADGHVDAHTQSVSATDQSQQWLLDLELW